ncbi:phage distal tail protein, Rcc01695 family [Nitratireductor rhodophyticola]
MPAPFLDAAIFPVHVSAGSPGGPDWAAEIVQLASGREERNSAWASPLRSYDAKYGVRTPAELYEVLSLYHAAMGRLSGFRFLDWTDYRSAAPHLTPTATDQQLGLGDGAETSFQLSKRYSFAGAHHDRRITRPFGTILVAVDGAPQAGGFTIDHTTGVITFDGAPANGAVLTWGGQFHVPVRFDCRLDQISLRTAAIGDIPSIFLKELRE